MGTSARTWIGGFLIATIGLAMLGGISNPAKLDGLPWG